MLLLIIPWVIAALVSQPASDKLITQVINY